MKCLALFILFACFVTITYSRSSIKSQTTITRNPSDYSVVDTLKNGKRLLSKNKNYAAVLSENGIFSTRRVLKAAPRRSKLESVDIWRSHEKPTGTGPFSVILTYEGNVELVDAKDSVIWQSDTRNRGAAPYKLVILDDGNLVLRDAKKTVIWDSFKDNERKKNMSQIGSLVVQTGETELIKNWLGKDAKFELCFRSSIHGGSSSTFHSRCDNKGPSITFIKTNNGLRFGGFTSISWDQSSTYKANDSTAFIFSLDKNVKFPVQIQNYVTYTTNGYGPTFGGGHDIHINSGMNGGYSNPHSYKGNNNSYPFAGNFTPVEVEVYLVNFS